jgi:DNA-binding beta-propeller fold protein YncE
VALITGPNIPQKGSWTFDIGFVGNQSQNYYLADSSNASIEIISTQTNKFVGRIGGFRSFHGDREVAGPAGILLDDSGQLWAGDGDSTVKLINLQSRSIVATLKTGGMKRADEMSYDPLDHILFVTNGADDVPFATFISTTKRAVVGKLVFAKADGGLEASVFDAQTHLFYLSIPANKQYPGGAVAAVDPITQNIVKQYSLPTTCDPSGIALNPGKQQLLIGCTGNPVIVSTQTGQIVTTITQTSGSDQVWYNSGDNRYYLANGKNPAGSILSVIDAATDTWIENITTAPNSHSVAVDPVTNHVFVPQTGRGIIVYSAKAP